VSREDRGRPSPTAARRPPVRIAKNGARRPARRSREDDDDGGGGPGWLLPALLAITLLLGSSAAWRWWGPTGHGGTPGDRRAAAIDPRAATGPSAAGFAVEKMRPAIEAPRAAGGPAVRVEVLNGSGEPMAAAKLASYLRQGGFNVIAVGSADRYDYLRTLVVARSDDDRPSRDVTRYLGDVDRVKQRARSEADVTVVVGKDRGRSPWGEGKDPNGRG
jgi:hypothetical protein